MIRIWEFFKKHPVLSLLVFMLIAYLPGLLSQRGFWVEDEARYAEILREMIGDGHWIVPHLNGAFYPDKPPTYFWLCSLLSLITGKITVSGCVFITVLSAAGTVIVTYFFGKRWISQPVGLISGLILASSFLFLGMAQIIRMDMQMSFFIALALFCFFLQYKEKRPYGYFLFYLFSAFAIMSKGPLGLAMTLVPVLFFLAGKRKWKTLVHVIFHWGFLLMLLIAGGWLLLAWMTGHQDFVLDIFKTQIFGRAVNSFIHKQPFYFYLLLLPFVFLPWSAYLVRAVVWFRKQHKEMSSFLSWWFITGLVIISMVSGKLFIYILPLMPPASIILGGFFHEMMTSRNKEGKSFAVESVLMTLLTFATMGSVVFFKSQLPSIRTATYTLLAAGCLTVIVPALWFSIRGKIRSLFLLFLTGMVMISYLVFFSIIPQIDSTLSAQKIGEKAGACLESGMTVSTFRVRRGIFNFYANGILGEIGEETLPDYFQEDKKTLIMQKKHYEKYRDILKGATTPIYEQEIANHDYVLIKTKESMVP